MKFAKQNWQWLILAFVMTPLLALMVQQLPFDQLTLSGQGALILFPYLGIAAWSVMWTHYASGALRQVISGLKPSKLYSKFSHGLVTILLLAHPGLLAYGQYDLSGVLPPTSYQAYVGAGAMVAVTAGIIALFIFLSYDIYRKLRSSEFWRRQQWLIAISQSLAMSLIFWHGLRLGQHLGSGWFRQWWMLLGLILLIGQYSDIKRAFDKRSATDKSQ